MFWGLFKPKIKCFVLFFNLLKTMKQKCFPRDWRMQSESSLPSNLYKKFSFLQSARVYLYALSHKNVKIDVFHCSHLFWDPEPCQLLCMNPCRWKNNAKAIQTYPEWMISQKAHLCTLRFSICEILHLHRSYEKNMYLWTHISELQIWGGWWNSKDCLILDSYL